MNKAHIKTENAENISWCGETLGNGFNFKDAEHAAIHGLHEGKINVCKNCIEIVVSCLDKVKQLEEDDANGTSKTHCS